MSTKPTQARPPRVAAALHVANACYAFSHEGGMYQHIFSSDFQIPGHVLSGFGLLDIPQGEGYPGALAWQTMDPNEFETVISRNLATGPPHEDVLVALAFCVMELTNDDADDAFDLLVSENVFEVKTTSQTNSVGNVVVPPVLTDYGRELEQRWLSWFDDH